MIVVAPAWAQSCADGSDVKVTQAEGVVEARRSGEADWSPVARGDVLCIGDSIRTQAYSLAMLEFTDEAYVKLEQNTAFNIAPPQDESRSWLDIIRGAIYIISRNPRAIAIVTPFGNAGVEGTEFLVAVNDDAASVTVFEGTVTFANNLGQASAGSGERVTARAGRQPIAQAVVRPRDAVQWTLYYAPIVGRSLPAPDAAVPPQRANDPSFYTSRAAARLDVGRVDEAKADIAQALALDMNNAVALSLQSIIAVTQNDKAEALRLADLAVAADRDSAAARIAQSYARQASFDISGALSSLQEAVDREPANALAWARLSELWLAVGDVDKALQSAQQAVALAPNIARTQTVLGFAYLTRVELGQAVEAFNLAIEYDDSAPLPRLGLGLALIRTGELVEGREQLEIAVMLDPGNALIRSYMGKAYYEENRDELASSQLAIAKELDPLDPTPYFYDAILKQTTNRPGEALEDLRKSVALNDNRAVYRSKLLLDEDLAARSASLARVFRDVGFIQPALVEGWKSVNADPTDYSGHRLLADLYSELPRHQIARVNSLFRSQLLQPSNVLPISPQLAEVNPFILDSAGPSELAFNEFNSLFDSNGLTVQGSGVTGSNGTQGADAVLSGIKDRFSFSLAAFDYETDGFRENNDFKQDLLTAFFQYRVSPKTSLQTELRTANIEHGDLALRFDPTLYVSNRRGSQDVDTVRIAARHDINTRSVFLASLIDQDAAGRDTIPPFYDSDGKTDSSSLDLQYMNQGETWHLTAGVNRIDLKQHSVTTTPSFIPDPPFVVEQTFDTTSEDYIENAYIYSTFRFAERVSLTIGVSYDSIDSSIRNDRWFNPKLGVMWRINPLTTFRAAAFRTVQAPFVSRFIIQPRLEPTQIAGFNQFFFGTPDEIVKHYGFGLDRELSSRLNVGFEVTERDIDFPFTDFTVTPPSPISVPIKRRMARAYSDFLLTQRIALSAEFQYENSDNDGMFLGEGFNKLQTRRMPLGINYHHPNGFSTSVTATVVEQAGNFEDMNGPGPPPFPVVTLKDSFTVLDASVRYRLPNRRGIVAVVVNNLLDEEFNFQDTDPENPRIFPERVGFLRFTVAF